MSEFRGKNRLGLYLLVLLLSVDHCTTHRSLDRILEILEPAAEDES